MKALYQPIPGASLTGANPREDAAGVVLYRQLRDARSLARSEERRRQQSSDMSERIRIAPAWDTVRSVAREILANHAKDIEALVWLTEAETRLSGFAGASACLSLMAELVETHGDALHSLPEDTAAERFEPIGALSGAGGEGTLLQPIRLLPLLPGAGFGEFSLWELQHGEDTAAAAEAIRNAPRSELETRLAEIDACLAAVAALDGRLTAMFGPDAPPTSRLTEVLGEAAAALRHAAGLSDAPEAAAETDAPEAEAGTAPVPARRVGPIDSREDAFRQLLEIARFFRDTEPHSPISAAIETVVRRGQMDFFALLKELVPDDGTRASVLTKAGIEPPKVEN